MSYKMIVMDMDGTLLNEEKKMTPKTIEALNKAEKQGIKTVIATGRLYNFAASYCEYLTQDQPIITNNGACILMTKSEEIIYNHPLKYEEMETIINAVEKQGLTCCFFTKDSLYAHVNDPMALRYERFNDDLPSQYKIKIYYIEHKEEWLKYYQSNPEGIYKCIVLEENVELLNRVRNELNQISDLQVASSFSINIEINANGVTKSKAVKMVADYYGISMDEVICIGDGENDLDMIEVAGLGVAMGNAVDKVKDIADYITDTNEEDGVAKVIEKFCLN